MVAAYVVGRFLHQNDLQTYRRRLAQALRQQAFFRMLPALIDLPVEILGPDGTPYSLNNAVNVGRHLTLSGLSGSGRRLALLQSALRWAEGPLSTIAPPVLIDLARLDDGASPPEELLAVAALAALRPADSKRLREPLAFLRRVVGNEDQQPHQYSLLISGWEALAAQRRALWRAALQTIAETALDTQLLIVLPADEPAWPAFTALATAPVTPAICTSWVEHLAPAEFRARIATGLALGGRLHPLSGRLLDIALLAWLTPALGLPQARAELYGQALATLLGLQAGELAHAPIVAKLQLLAAYDEQPPEPSANLTECDQYGRTHFVHAQLRRYLAARELVAEQRYDLLGALAPSECAELAQIIATMLDDPAPLYAALWAQLPSQPAATLSLAGCLRERAPHNPTWTLRVVAVLAQQLHAGDEALRDQAGQLLDSCMPALDACLPLAARAGEPIDRFLLQLFELLPDQLAAPRMRQLSLNAETPEAFAWQLTDRVFDRAPAEEYSPAPHFDPRAMARWIYVQARRHPAGYKQIDPATMVAALHALASSQAGEARKLFVATALLENAAQPVAVRLAALELLSDTSQPTAHTVVERACSDTHPDFRRKALELLSQLDPERAAVALGRAAMDGAASWELRLAAIRHLGETKPQGAERLLAHCAKDLTLPLYARLTAIRALSNGHDGSAELINTIKNPNEHPILRATAACALGADGDAEGVAELIQQINSPHTPAILVEGCCRAIGALGHSEAAAPLKQLLDRNAANLPLTLAALHALGQIGALEQSDFISPLLGAEALDRLKRDLKPGLCEQPIDDCLQDPALPAPIAEQLAFALAASPTAESRPSTLGEFLNGEADRIRVEAARALIAIGGHTARAALLAALLDNASGAATEEIIAALAELEGPELADSFGYLLAAAEVQPLTHWLVARLLTNHPAGEPVMLQALENNALDPFTRGALAEGLGQRRAPSAMIVLRRLAEDVTGDAHLRSQALLGLALLDDPSVETILIRLIGEPSEELALRGLAAEALPSQLSAEGRRFLRELLRAERTLDPLAIGALRTLGRIRDREALPLLLRYCNSQATSVAHAAIDALGDMGDGSVAPVLVRVSQQHAVDHTLRLQAIGALLRIGGDGYLPLLRAYLHQGALPFRMLALEALLGSTVPAGDLLTILSNQSWPAAMRLRLIEFFAGDTAAAPALIGLLEAAGDEVQLRVLAAEALGRLRWADAAPALSRHAERADTPLALRLCCIAALHKLDQTASWATLSRLAEDSAQPPAIRDCAWHALYAAGCAGSSKETEISA